MPCVVLFACGSEDTTGPRQRQQTPEPTVTTVVVTPGSATLLSVGETVQLTASARDAAGNAISGKTFTWVSSDSAVVTVNDGLAVAVIEGEADVVATTDGLADTAHIAVLFPPMTLVYPVNGVRIVQNDSTIGCAAHEYRGYGFEIRFDWTDAAAASGVSRYYLWVKHRGSQYPSVSRYVTGSEFTDLNCNGFVIDRNLDRWEWKVSALDAAGNVIAESEVADFGFAPCRHSTERMCSAPGP